MTDLLVDRPAGSPVATLVLAHGAGGPMDSPVLNAVASALAAAGLTVARFEFAYMAARREGRRLPPPPVRRLVPEFEAALAACLDQTRGPLLVGGKSMGSRVAALLAAGETDRRVVGLVALGFPFHPPASPEKSRLAELAACRLPALVLQGTRDPFGTPAMLAGASLPETIRLVWFEDSDHDLKPRKASGQSLSGHLATAAAAVADFARQLNST
jgi:predicted alpha/beta-hydrolase family hydrolase